MKVKITILAWLFCSAFVSAQERLDISFGESVDLGIIEDDTQFLITDGASKQIKIKGSKINSYKFQKPGTYQIDIITTENSEKDNCVHHLSTNKIHVNVSRIRMTFLANRITFSQPIQKNRESAGTTLTVPVKIETYDHQPVSFTSDVVYSAGIGSSITAKLSNSYNKLSEGTHAIAYALNGKVTENSYLMFDFIDANGKIQSAALSQPISN